MLFLGRFLCRDFRLVGGAPRLLLGFAGGLLGGDLRLAGRLLGGGAGRRLLFAALALLLEPNQQIAQILGLAGHRLLALLGDGPLAFGLDLGFLLFLIERGQALMLAIQLGDSGGDQLLLLGDVGFDRGQAFDVGLEARHLRLDPRHHVLEQDGAAHRVGGRGRLGDQRFGRAESQALDRGQHAVQLLALEVQGLGLVALDSGQIRHLALEVGQAVLVLLHATRGGDHFGAHLLGRLGGGLGPALDLLLFLLAPLQRGFQLFQAGFRLGRLGRLHLPAQKGQEDRSS